MRVLIVDGQLSARRTLAGILGGMRDIALLEAATVPEAQAMIASVQFDVAIVALHVGGDTRNPEGLTVVNEINERTSAIPIIVSESRDLADIRMAMRAGAYDYLPKGDLCDTLVFRLFEELRSQVRRPRGIRSPGTRRSTPPIVSGLVGASPAMERLREVVRLVAQSDRPVLVVGPTGSGKELVVRAIHAHGLHSSEPLIDVNCGAIPEPLMESFLFGHERGAFTGATRRQEGHLTLVRKGTLFLDEIAELPLTLQTKLLRVLETRRFSPVGSPNVKHFEGRVVAATHTPLEERTTANRFREDLFYRLNVLTVRVPALEERIEDLPALVEHFCLQQKRPLHFSPLALNLLRVVPWPGNVRQLRNLVDRLAVFAERDLVTPELLEHSLLAPANAEPAPERMEVLLSAVLRLSGDNKLEAFEEALIACALVTCAGNKSAAARLLGVHRKAIERRLGKPAKNLALPLGLPTSFV
jgi:DNA-binding NtrC family response regulator